jgi:hypothetical protein
MTYKKIDANQNAIVRTLRDMGVSVVSLASVGKGCADLVCGFRGRNYLVEIKNLDGRGDKLTPAEQRFFDEWRGQITVFRCVDDAVEFFEEVE